MAFTPTLTLPDLSRTTIVQCIMTHFRGIFDSTRHVVTELLRNYRTSHQLSISEIQPDQRCVCVTESSGPLIDSPHCTFSSSLSRVTSSINHPNPSPLPLRTPSDALNARKMFASLLRTLTSRHVSSRTVMDATEFSHCAEESRHTLPSIRSPHHTAFCHVCLLRVQAIIVDARFLFRATDRCGIQTSPFGGVRL